MTTSREVKENYSMSGMTAGQGLVNGGIEAVDYTLKNSMPSLIEEQEWGVQTIIQFATDSTTVRNQMALAKSNGYLVLNSLAGQVASDKGSASSQVNGLYATAAMSAKTGDLGAAINVVNQVLSNADLMAELMREQEWTPMAVIQFASDSNEIKTAMGLAKSNGSIVLTHLAVSIKV